MAVRARYPIEPHVNVLDSVNRAGQMAHLAYSLRGFLSTPLELDDARATLRQRMSERERRFLIMVGRLVFERPRSPYRDLLLWAGFDRPRLEALVLADGVEGTLETLRDAGVYVTLDEVRGRQTIVRDDLTIQVRASDFDNPYLMGRAMAGSTSGSSAAPRRVMLDWAGLAEEAAENLLLYEMHGLLDAPLALWLAVAPGAAGLNALMVNAKRGHPPEAWFSPISTNLPGTPLAARLGHRWTSMVGRTAGLRLPRPELTRFTDAAGVARWVANARDHHGTCVLRTTASAAVRVAEAAAADAIDVRGSVMLVAGEPLTAPRRRAIEAVGLKVIPHYGAAEIGLIAGGCSRSNRCDDMHIFLDRLALTTLPRSAGVGVAEFDSLLFTSLSLHAPVVLLNAEIGDHALVERRACGCSLAELGMDVHVSRVRSHSKLTGEGLALLGGELDEAVAACIERAGGGPNDYQFSERREGAGATRLQLCVAPELAIDEERFLSSVLDELRKRAPGGSLVAELWRDAATMDLVRVRPEPTIALKTLPLVSHTDETSGP